MLEILGTIAADILNLPGILGLALGMSTRNPAIGAALGGLVGFLKTIVFANFVFAGIPPLELVISILVGIVFGALGSLIRIKGATV